MVRWMLLGYGIGALLEPAAGRSLTSAEIARTVVVRASQYRAGGVGRGDRVFVHFGNCADFFVEVLAAWQVGACVVPVDPSFTPFEVGTLADWARPRASIWLEPPNAAYTSAVHDSGAELVDLSSVDIATASTSAQCDVHLDDDALILFTSGTTGDPKGVVHTHRSLRARWSSLRDHLGLDAFERTLCILPTHFGHGLICNSLFPWLSGCDLYVQPPFRPENVVALGDTIDEHAITFMSSVPAMWRLTLRLARPPERRSLRRVFVGSAPLSEALWRSVQDWCGTTNVLNAYGITETGSWLAGTTVDDFEPEDGLVGVPWGGTVRILRRGEPGAESDAGAVCEPGELGHVWISTPALMRGYLDRDDLTRQVVSNGWFSTGDIGMVDRDGRLHLRGREREEINKGGLKVYPADVDGVIERFSGAVDVCAFAFEDPLLGEDVGVAVVLRDDAPESTMSELHAWAAEHLAQHQLPRRWYVVPEIPRTSRGKVNRQKVATWCSSQTPVDGSTLRSTEP